MSSTLRRCRSLWRSKERYKQELDAHSSAGKGTVWLSPDIVNFSQPIQVLYNGKSLTENKVVIPDIAVLLEDVRQRTANAGIRFGPDLMRSR